MARVLIVLMLLASASVRAQEQLWFGLLHAHTSFSDGSGTPEDAFTRARSKGVDFFALTEHNHAAAEMGAGSRADGILIANEHALYESADLVTITSNGQDRRVKSVTRAARDASNANYVAIPGQEFSSISSGNHANVLGIEDVITVSNGDYAGLYSLLDDLAAAGTPVVVQFNHPDIQRDLFYGGNDHSERNKMFNDYGFDDFGRDFSRLVAAADRHVALIEVFSGPMATTNKRVNDYRYSDHGDDYYFYLVQGFHLSPSAGHDDHHRHWGDKSPARTGVYAADLTPTSLFAAMHNNRTFATEDKNLSVDLRLNGTPMGGVLALDRDAPVEIDVDINDTDDGNAQCTVTLVYGVVDPRSGGNLQRLRESDGLQESASRQGNGAVHFGGNVASGAAEFYYAIIEQDDGNRAWTAPVWINHARDGAAPAAPEPTPPGEESFVWTKNASRYYHHPWCTSAAKILPVNLRAGDTPPVGRELHNCVRDEDDPEH